ncbi:carbohydrate-binding module family 18 protein [Halenospora varia]|nr:carbohydrate-binding module family 18 protein [Halenospora varia]
MHFTTALAALALSATTISAHMELSYPAPLRSKFNQNALKAAPGKIDYSMTAPITAAQFPCKGYQTDMADTAGAGAPTTTWTQGQKANITVAGSAVHGGGSCQAALSYDTGKTWKVIHSWIGSCPLSAGENFDFTVPSDAATGTALFAWTWLNMIGNREYYMNCASVNIAAGTGTKSAVALSARPDLFVANLNNGCTTKEQNDYIYPNPGPDADVTKKTTKSNTDSGVTGTCAAVAGVGGGSSSSGSGSSGSSPSSAVNAPASSAAPVASSAAPAPTGGSFITSSVASKPTSSVISINPLPTTSATPVASKPVPAPEAPSSTASFAPQASTGAKKLSTDGECGGLQTCHDGTTASTFGACCSTYGYCGSTAMHCGTGCMSAFGQCGVNGTSAVRMLRGRRYGA